MADVQLKESSGKKKGLRRPKRRVSIRIDMTPMVDIAFLLLIFYMVTTIFAAPQAMEINLPPKDQDSVSVPTKVKESNLLRVFVDKNDDFYYMIGTELRTGQDIKVPWKIPKDSIRNLFIDYNRARSSLNTLLWIHPDAKYSRMVDLLDETEVVEALLRGSPEFMREYLSRRPEEKTFSFRYALDHWGPKQDKLMEKVYNPRAGGL